MKTKSAILLTLFVSFMLLQANNEASSKPGSFMPTTAGNLGSHHRDLVIVLAPGEVRQIPLPETAGPIFVMHNNSATPMLEGGLIAIDPTTGAVRPWNNTSVFIGDDKIMIDPNGPSSENGFFVYNKTADEAITFRVSFLY